MWAYHIRYQWFLPIHTWSFTIYGLVATLWHCRQLDQRFRVLANSGAGWVAGLKFRSGLRRGRWWNFCKDQILSGNQKKALIRKNLGSCDLFIAIDGSQQIPKTKTLRCLVNKPVKAGDFYAKWDHARHWFWRFWFLKPSSRVIPPTRFMIWVLRSFCGNFTPGNTLMC